MRLIDADELKKALAEMWYESAISITGVSVSELIDQAPTIEPSGGLISRQDAIDSINKTNSTLDEVPICKDIRSAFANAIKSLPSADRPQGEDWDKYSEKLWKSAYERGLNDRSKGEWIKVGHDIYECSLCKQHVMTRDIDCYMFCHRCGADMRCGS